MQLTAGPSDRFAISVVDTVPGSLARVRLRAAGEVDLSTAPILLSALLAALETPDLAELEVELDGVTFLGAQGVSALLQGVRRARAVGCHLRLRHPQSNVRRVLEITGVTGACEVE